MQEPVIQISHLNKQYTIYKGEMAQLAGFLFNRKCGERIHALRDINLSIYQGEIVGFVGLNGSGKSTLSRIIAGITHQTSGDVTIQGTASMLSAGVGLDSNLTGKENIQYKCLLLGFTPQRIREIEQKIIDFADIGVYIDQPLRMYSSGMRARLGFAISIHLDPDILIVDEALSVGDVSFSEKCMERMRALCQAGKTVIFVSHSSAQMEKLCSRILWLHKGECVGYGETQDIMTEYKAFAAQWRGMSAEERAVCRPKLNEERRKVL